MFVHLVILQVIVYFPVISVPVYLSHMKKMGFVSFVVTPYLIATLVRIPTSVLDVKQVILSKMILNHASIAKVQLMGVKLVHQQLTVQAVRVLSAWSIIDADVPSISILPHNFGASVEAILLLD